MERGGREAGGRRTAPGRRCGPAASSPVAGAGAAERALVGGGGRGAGGPAGSAEEGARGSRAPAAARPRSLRQTPPSRAGGSADLSPSTWRLGQGCGAPGKARTLGALWPRESARSAITEARGPGFPGSGVGV